MEETTIDRPEPESQRKRPVLLVVLSILTWMGCAGLIFFFGYLFISVANKSSVREADLLLWMLLINMICSVLSLAGSIVMWTRRKWGFYVYVAGQLVPVLFTLYLVGSGQIHTENMTSLAAIMFVLWIAVP